MFGKFFEMGAGNLAMGLAGHIANRSLESQIRDMITDQLLNRNESNRNSKSTTRTETKEEEEEEENMKGGMGGTGFGGGFGGLAVGIGVAIATSLVQSLASQQRNNYQHRQHWSQEEDSSDDEKRKLKDVVVIGCGAAGIAALSKLQEAGLDVVGLEAGDRIGGRIHTVDFADGVVDLGAAWCHGEEGNKVYELAAPMLGRPDGEEEKWFVFSNGTLMPLGNAQTVVHKIKKTLDDANKNNSRSISQCIREDVGVNTIVDPGKIPVTGPFIEWYERDMHVGGQQDEPSKGKSLKGLSEHQPCRGEYWLHWKGMGYKTILDVMLRKSSPDIQLNKEVSSIRWQLIETDDKDKKKRPYVEVMCTDGTKINTKTVVITVSIGVLKGSHRRLFSPSLPSDKVNSIENIQFCVLDKIYIEFSTQWWPTPPASFNIIWKAEDIREFSASEKWVTEIYGLRTVEGKPKVLLAWIYGKGAEQMEGKSMVEVKAGVQKLMDRVFSLNFEVSRIVNIKSSQWASNKFVRGSYSYRSVSTEVSGASASDLATPLQHMGVNVAYFAGEATSTRQHNSVHGAIDTGFTVAQNIIRTISRD